MPGVPPGRYHLRLVPDIADVVVALSSARKQEAVGDGFACDDDSEAQTGELVPKLAA